MFRRGAIFAILLAVAVGVCGSQTVNWIKFVPPDGSFSVLMPEKPVLNSSTVDKPSGKIVTNIWVADTSQGFYLAGVTDYPADIDVQKELDLSRDNFIKAVEAKLVSESDFTLKGYRGKEFTGVSSSDTFKVRELVVGRRNYLEAVRDNTASFNIERANKFLLSFDLTQDAK
jgi:hypothetical protein